MTYKKISLIDPPNDDSRTAINSLSLDEKIEMYNMTKGRNTNLELFLEENIAYHAQPHECEHLMRNVFDTFAVKARGLLSKKLREDSPTVA